MSPKKMLALPSNETCIFCETVLSSLPTTCLVVCRDATQDSPQSGCNMGFCVSCIDKYLRECRQKCPGCRSPSILGHHLLAIDPSTIGPPPSPLYEPIVPPEFDNDSDNESNDTLDTSLIYRLLLNTTHGTFTDLFYLLQGDKLFLIAQLLAHLPLLRMLETRAPDSLRSLIEAIQLLDDPLLLPIINLIKNQ